MKESWAVEWTVVLPDSSRAHGHIRRDIRRDCVSLKLDLDKRYGQMIRTNISRVTTRFE